MTREQIRAAIEQSKRLVAANQAESAATKAAYGIKEPTK